jgi:hypothetical protein
MATGKGNERREVQTGAFNTDFVEIKSGLTEGEKVLLNPPRLAGPAVKGKSTAYEKPLPQGQPAQAGKAPADLPQPTESAVKGKSADYEKPLQQGQSAQSGKAPADFMQPTEPPARDKSRTHGNHSPRHQGEQK